METNEATAVQATGRRDPLGASLGILLPTEDEWRERTQSPEQACLARRAAEVPDIRAERVAELRRAIQTGAYRVDPAAIAEGMLGHLSRTSRTVR